MIFGVEQSSYDAIYFVQNHKVVKEMVLGEFEAVLDGVVSESDFAGEECHAVYLKIDKRLNILAAVFFIIEFDTDGALKLGWNLPLDQLAETAAYGPSVNGLSIRMACRSQCPIAWLSGELWEPDLSPTKNTLKLLATQVKQNKLGFYVEKSDPADSAALAMASADNVPLVDQRVDTQVDESDDAVNELAAMRSDHELSLKNATGADYDRVVAALSEREEMLRANLRKKRKDERDKALIQQRDNMAQGIKKLRARLASATEQHQLAVDKLKREHAEELDRQKFKMDSYTQQQLALEKKNTVLKDENLLLQDQLRVQRESHEQQVVDMAEQNGFDHEALRKHMRRELQAKLIEHTSELESRIELKEVEANYREEQIRRLQRELTELKLAPQATPVRGDFFQAAENLEGLGMHFLISLPAIGPVRVPAAELEAFSADSNAYLAERHGVDKKLFAQWFEFAKNPVCGFRHADGSVCGEPIKLCKPQEFELRISDRCEKHELEDDANDQKYA